MARPKESVDFNPYDQEVVNNPHEFWHKMASECPVATYPSEIQSTHIISGYDDVRAALRDTETFGSELDAVQIGQVRPMIPLQIDPPEHARYRRILDPHFGPRQVAFLEADFRKFVNEVIDEFIDAGECDFHDDFALPIPCTMFLRLMGMPLEDLDLLVGMKEGLMRPAIRDIEDPVAAMKLRRQTADEIYDYFGQAIADKRANPGDDIFTAVVSAGADDDGKQLSDEELLDMSFLFLIAGLDTVTASLDCIVKRLALDDALRATVAADPGCAEAVVEELMRAETPVTAILRIAKTDTEIAGNEIAAGEHVTILLGAANHDPDEFDTPLELDHERERNRHVAFGGGPHRCLGSHLARLELRVAIEEFHKRIPDYAPTSGFEPMHAIGIRQLSPFPLVFGDRLAATRA